MNNDACLCVCALARQRNFAVLTLRLITMINLKKVHLVAQPVPVSGGSRVHPFEASYSDQNETEKRSTQSRPPPNEIGCSQRTQIRHGKGGVPFAFLSFGRALDETRDKPPQPSRTAGRGSAGRTYFSSALLGPSTWIALGGTAPPPPSHSPKRRNLLSAIRPWMRPTREQREGPGESGNHRSCRDCEMAPPTQLPSPRLSRSFGACSWQRKSGDAHSA